MKKEDYRIRVGDVLYEPSVSYGRVIKHRIIAIFMEEYLSGWKTMIVTDSDLGTNTRFFYRCS